MVHVFSLSSSSNGSQFNLLNKATVLSFCILVSKITRAALFWSLNTLRRFSLLVEDHISPPNMFSIQCSRSRVQVLRSSRRLLASWQGEELLIVVSSAKISAIAGYDIDSGRSLINIRNSKGARTEPCGTPWVKTGMRKVDYI